MKKIVISKVKSRDLPTLMIFMLNQRYKTELGKFIVMYSRKENVLYVNEKIPDADIEKFITISEYEGKYINDPDCKIADITEYVYQKYGFKVWSILIEVYSAKQKEKEDVTARSEAKELYEIIHRYDTDDNSPDPFYNKERLIYHLGRLAGKDGLQTTENIVSCGTKYAFLFGYLLGNGTISEKDGVAV